MQSQNFNLHVLSSHAKLLGGHLLTFDLQIKMPNLPTYSMQEIYCACRQVKETAGFHTGVFVGGGGEGTFIYYSKGGHYSRCRL